MKFMIQHNLLDPTRLDTLKEAVKDYPHEFIGLIPFSREITSNEPIEGTDLPPDPQLEDFRRINFARNELIARDSELIIACVAKDRLGGTENTLKHFLKTYNKPKENLILVEDLSDVNDFFL